ncbi:ribose-5-phosphate isomerase A [Halogeometricum pallidum JCM 14848]|uniref:Ribose-5-phosphate isomerase A n=1 Tax=Halogeometricum pallidum JCM 14848 TaxID=1227487 RepID=M0D6E0_HALPD|nr:ribose-5-phosphate isomerase RpiA [Halogeometricum pallidum]ELZ31015.1 ribose-5-phosphate isomerase A [Halogeometricum pallidum JCM 14848]
MKTTGGTDDQKRRAAERAADLVSSGETVGLGTGSTAAFAVRALGRAVEAGELEDVFGVATSFASRELAREAGVPLCSLDEVECIDVAIDGSDQVDADGNLIKGGGAAHAREKVVDAAAHRFVVVADPSKLAETLDRPVPLEVLPAARTLVSARVDELGGDPVLRTADRKDGPVVTDNGNFVLDCDFGAIDDPASLSADLSATPGVVEHGLFVGLADEAYVGTDDGVDARTY